MLIADSKLKLIYHECSFLSKTHTNPPSDASEVVWSSNSPAFIQMQIISKQESRAEHRGRQPSASHCYCLLLAAEQ